VRFYLDENQPVKAAEIARRNGVDVVAAEERGCKGATDEIQLEFAAGEGRALVTRDYRDFEHLTRQAMEDGRQHAGVLFVSPSLAQSDLAGIAEALRAYEREHPDGMPAYAIDYLVPVRRGSERG